MFWESNPIRVAITSYKISKIQYIHILVMLRDKTLIPQWEREIPFLLGANEKKEQTQTNTLVLKVEH